MRPLPYASLATLLIVASVSVSAHAAPNSEVLEWVAQDAEHACRLRSMSGDTQQFAYVSAGGAPVYGGWTFTASGTLLGSNWYTLPDAPPCSVRALSRGQGHGYREPFLAVCDSPSESRVFVYDTGSAAPRTWAEVPIEFSASSSTLSLDLATSIGSPNSPWMLVVGGAILDAVGGSSSTPALFAYRAGLDTAMRLLAPASGDWSEGGRVTAMSSVSYFSNLYPVFFVALEKRGVYRVTLTDEHITADKVFDLPGVSKLVANHGLDRSLLVALTSDALYTTDTRPTAATSTPWTWTRSVPFSNVRDVALPERSYRDDARIVAVGAEGGSGHVATSLDGTTWEVQSVPTSTPPLDCAASAWRSVSSQEQRGWAQWILAVSAPRPAMSSTVDGGPSLENTGVALAGAYVPLVEDAGAPEPADTGAPDAADAGRDTCSVGEEFYPPTQRCEPRRRPSGGWLGGNSVAHGVAGGLLLLWTAVSVLRNRARTKREPAERG